MQRLERGIVLALTLGLAVLLAFHVAPLAAGIGVLVLGATIDMDTFANMLKVNYEEPFHNQIVVFSKVMDVMKGNFKVKQGAQGKYIESTNLFGGPEGGGWRSANANLPVPGNPTFVPGRVKLKTYLHTIQINRAAMANAMRGPAAFADWGEVTLKPAARLVAADLDRCFIGFGSGALCRIDGSPASSAIPIDSPYGLPGNTKGWLPGIRRGMRIVAASDIDGTGMRSNGKSMLVLSVTKSGNSGGGSIKVDTLLPDLADNDYLFRGDDQGSNAPEDGTEVEMMGIMGHVDDGTLVPVHQNIDRTIYDEWKAQFIDGSAAPYNGDAIEDLFNRLSDDVLELGDGELSHILTTLTIVRGAYKELRTARGGFGGSDSGGQKQRMGAKGITIWVGDREVEIRGLPKMPPGRIYGLQASDFERYHLKSGSFEWVNWTGSMFHQVVLGGAIKDAVWMYGRVEIETGCHAPQHQIFVTGVDETQY